MRFSEKDRILVVAAHPDDETLGMGASIARFIQLGVSLKVLMLGEGPTSRAEAGAGEVRKTASNEFQNAMSKLGVQEFESLCLPDQRFEETSFVDLTEKIKKALLAFEGNILFTHYSNDLNRDHRFCSEACQVVARGTPDSKLNGVFFFETLSSTEWSDASMHQFVPQLYIDISQTLSTKIKAFQSYKSEIRDFPHPRSEEAIEALAKLRGSQSGFKAAEAFQVFRQYVRA